MLNLSAIINQHKESYPRFTKPVTDSWTREKKNNEAGDIIQLVPNSTRNENPVNISTQYKDNPRMKAQEDAALDDHLKLQQKMTAHTK